MCNCPDSGCTPCPPSPCPPTPPTPAPTPTCCTDCDKWIQQQDDDDWSCQYPDGQDNCCPDYCPVLGLGAAFCQQLVTGDNNIKFFGSYGFNLPMNRRKNAFNVKKSGLYAVAYYIDASLPAADVSQASEYTVSIDIDRCNAENMRCDPKYTNISWASGQIDPAIGDICTRISGGIASGSAYYIWAVRLIFLNKGDRLKLSIASPGQSRVTTAFFGALRLMPCNCIPPGGLPEIDLGLSIPTGVGSNGIRSMSAPVQSMLTNLLSGPLSGVVSAVLPTLLQDSLPDVLQTYLNQNAPNNESC